MFEAGKRGDLEAVSLVRKFSVDEQTTDVAQMFVFACKGACLNGHTHVVAALLELGLDIARYGSEVRAQWASERAHLLRFLLVTHVRLQ